MRWIVHGIGGAILVLLIYAWGGEPRSTTLTTASTTTTAAPPVQQAPPWYRHRWAYALYGGAALALTAVLLLKWYTAALERRQARLEATVAERATEAQQQAERLEAYNRELVQTNERLRQAHEEKSRLLGVAAHDLKNPLFGIRALAEVVLETENFDDSTQRKLRLIRDSADETLHLINDLLTSAAQASQAAPEREPLDMGALSEWVVHSFEPQAQRKGQALHYSGPEDQSIVEGEKRHLREAMNNLVSNALKYAPPDSQIEVSVDVEGDMAQFAVTDEGPGLGERDQQRLFAPFQRLTPEPTGDEGSSGLGLYIVKQVVERHDGHVEVDTALGKGSTFTLVLPVAERVPTAEREHEMA